MKYIKGFDGLRAVSIILVILTHAGLWDSFGDSYLVKEHFNLFSGVAGVIIFFCISGFLITSLLLHEKKQTGSIHFRFFFIRRFLRLLPPLLLFYTAILILMISGYLERNYPAVVVSFFYLYNFVPRRFYTPELGHTWSLAVEEQFYLVWPFVLSFLKKFRALLLLATALILSCIFFRLFGNIHFVYNGKADDLLHYFFIERWFIPACLPIMTGALAAILNFFYTEKVSKLIKEKYLFLLLALVLYPIQLILPVPGVIRELILPVSISLLLLWIVYNQESVLVKTLEFKPIAFIGKISYGIYVYQGLFLRTGAGGKLTIQQFPLNIILVLVTAVLSWYLFEKKIMKVKELYSNKNE